jgi:hypothetical protein
MTEGQKYQRGYRVKILSRLAEGEHPILGGTWENTAVGEEAIIEYSSIERPKLFDVEGYNGGVCYGILILYENRNPRRIKWFEEQFLELICCNEAKGEKILKETALARA